MTTPQYPTDPQGAQPGAPNPQPQAAEQTTPTTLNGVTVFVPNQVTTDVKMMFSLDHPDLITTDANQLAQFPLNIFQRMNPFRRRPKQHRAGANANPSTAASTSGASGSGSLPPTDLRGATPGEHDPKESKWSRGRMREAADKSLQLALDLLNHSQSGQLMLTQNALDGAVGIEKKLDNLIAFIKQQRGQWRWRRNLWRFAWPPSDDRLDLHLIKLYAIFEDMRAACHQYHSTFAKKHAPGIWENFDKHLGGASNQAAVLDHRLRARDTYLMLPKVNSHAKHVRNSLHALLAKSDGKVNIATVNLEVTTIAQFAIANLIKLHPLLSQPPVPASQPTAQTCLNCGKQNVIGNFCSKCGAPNGTILCPTCQTSNHVDAIFCQNCGNSMTLPPASPATGAAAVPPSPAPPNAGQASPPSAAPPNYSPHQPNNNPTNQGTNQVPQPGFPQPPNTP